MNSSRRPRLVLLAGRDDSSNIVYHALTEISDVVAVIEENPPSKLRMTKRRIKRLGLLRVADQLLFIALVVPILRARSLRRIEALRLQFGMDAAPIPRQKVLPVLSINHPSVIELLKAQEPDVVVINGTRIIGRPVLGSVEAPFINTHAGVTPAYRGVHGGYWALAEGKPELAGVTVHCVDTGVDTGDVIAQALINPGPEDTFYTYPTLQLAAGLPLLKKAVLDIHRYGLQTSKPLSSASRLYYHPGFTEYLIYRVRKGIR